MTGKTKTGFEYDIDDRILTDWRLTTAIVETRDKDDFKKLKASQQIAKLLLGEDGLDALLEHVAGQNEGFVPTEKFMGELQDIFETQKVKNSDSSHTA